MTGPDAPTELATAARTVRHLVQEADASRSANPRRRLHPRDLDLDYRNLRELERVTFHIQDMTEVLSDVIWKGRSPLHGSIPGQRATGGRHERHRRAAAFIQHRRSGISRHSMFTAAEAAVKACMAATAERELDEGTVTASESILLSLHRILRSVRPGTAAS
jgi:hypothetical protein